MIALALLLATPGQLHLGLDPNSIPQQLAFYELFPDSPEGKSAQKRAWQLLSGGAEDMPEGCTLTPLSTERLMTLVDLLAKQRLERGASLETSEIEAIEQLASRLPHNKLAGHTVWTEEEMRALDEEEFDLCRALLLSQCDDPEQIRSYEATVDLMALQILTRTSLSDAPEKKIRAINDFLFRETGVRFPPHTLFAKEIDHYTFLASVLDGQQGVCLGVSSLYLCLAQRLDLSMEIVTPPGHIYVRYRDAEREINVETTMRGVHVPSKHYLGVHTRKLQERSIKEVVGLAFQNQGSALWSKGDAKGAVVAYQKALLYLPDDLLIQELLGYTLCLTGKEREGRRLLEKVRDKVPDHAISASSMVNDLLDGQVDAAGISCCFDHVDETRDSILAKQERVREVVQKWPKFSSGWFCYATGWLQLGRCGEALEALRRVHELNQSDETAEYYLAALCLERHDYNKAWDHLRRAEEITQARGADPKALKALRHALRRVAPE